jgi:hypothetical protein
MGAASVPSGSNERPFLLDTSEEGEPEDSRVCPLLRDCALSRLVVRSRGSMGRDWREREGGGGSGSRAGTAGWHLKVDGHGLCTFVPMFVLYVLAFLSSDLASMLVAAAANQYGMLELKWYNCFIHSLGC